MKKETSLSKLFPVLFGFFIMGFVDVVGIATNYVKMDFNLNDTVANLLPMMVFLWFAVFSVPTGLLMNSIGRKKTVALSMVITFVAMLIPLIAYQFTVIMIAFALLGIGNTILQVSLNPLLQNVVRGDRLTSSLTWGQFIKAIASFLGPVIAGFAASSLGNWKMLFPIFAGITLISTLWLYFTSIDEQPVEGKNSSFGSCFALLKDRTILMLFLGILFVVGIDVGLNITIPKFLMERTGMLLEQAGLGTSLYFIARTTGAFIGAILLVRISGRNFLIVSMIAAIIGMILMLMMGAAWAILVLIFVLGFAVANVFSIIFSAALQRKPERGNEISGLMIMGVAGGAVMPPLMGIVSDATGQAGGLALLLVAMVYLLICAFVVLKTENKS
ncbi:MAG: MFS transporter [Alphaproteobacteria bacterium]|nr:MFS transporter [Alphaproteobacteria bacterium]